MIKDKPPLVVESDPAQEFPLTNAKGKHYREELRDEHTIRIFPDGTEYDYTAKRLVRGTKQAVQLFKEKGRELQALGQESIKQDIMQGAREAVANKLDLPANRITDARVRQSIAQAQAERALDINNPQGVHGANWISEHGGWKPTRERVRLQSGEESLTGAPDAVAELLTLIRGERNRRRDEDGTPFAGDLVEDNEKVAGE